MNNRTNIRITINIDGQNYSSNHVFSQAIGDASWSKEKMVEAAIKSFTEKVKRELKEKGDQDEGI